MALGVVGDLALVDCLGVLEAMKQLARSGMTMIVVTHEKGFGHDVGDQVVFMDLGGGGREGRARRGVANPRHERTKAFLSRVL